jgi:hypothetical protein
LLPAQPTPVPLLKGQLYFKFSGKLGCVVTSDIKPGTALPDDAARTLQQIYAQQELIRAAAQLWLLKPDIQLPSAIYDAFSNLGVLSDSELDLVKTSVSMTLQHALDKIDEVGSGGSLKVDESVGKCTLSAVPCVCMLLDGLIYRAAVAKQLPCVEKRSITSGLQFYNELPQLLGAPLARTVSCFLTGQLGLRTTAAHDVLPYHLHPALVLYLFYVFYQVCGHFKSMAPLPLIAQAEKSEVYLVPWTEHEKSARVDQATTVLRSRTFGLYFKRMT